MLMNLTRHSYVQAWMLYQQGRLLEIVDASMGSYPEKEVLRYIKVGLACTQATPSSRPTMRQVLALLSERRCSRRVSPSTAATTRPLPWGVCPPVR